ncbi:hypothetical protein BGX34_003873, partial [Mortierella sp. NVP85]
QNEGNNSNNNNNNNSDLYWDILPTNSQHTSASSSSQSSPTTTTTQTQSTQTVLPSQTKMKTNTSDQSASSRIDALKATIRSVMAILYELEITDIKSDVKPPPPGDPSKMEDDIYILWCAAPTTKWYKQQLFKLIEDLQVKEERERKRLRDDADAKSAPLYDNDLSPHRKYLRTKMDAVKQAAFEFYPLRSEGKTRSILPRDPESIDVDIFLVWCLRSADYTECRRSDRYLGCKHANTQSYDQELGSLLESLKLRDEDERYYLRKLKEKAAAAASKETRE